MGAKAIRSHLLGSSISLRSHCMQTVGSSSPQSSRLVFVSPTTNCPPPLLGWAVNVFTWTQLVPGERRRPGSSATAPARISGPPSAAGLARAGRGRCGNSLMDVRISVVVEPVVATVTGHSLSLSTYDLSNWIYIIPCVVSTLLLCPVYKNKGTYGLFKRFEPPPLTVTQQAPPRLSSAPPPHPPPPLPPVRSGISAWKP